MKTNRQATLLILLPLFLGTVVFASCKKSGEGHEGEGELLKLTATRPLIRTTTLDKEYVCQIRGAQHIEVRAIESGYLQKVYPDEGEQVKKGQPMFQILPVVYQAELKKAQAEAEYAKQEFKNTKLLADREVVSPNELALANAKRSKATAEVSLAQAHRRMTQIRAPFTGIMDRLEVRPGSLLEDGELLTRLSDITRLWVYFNVSEIDYLDYREQQAGKKDPIEVELIMANGRPFEEKGFIETIEADFDNETGTIPFRALFNNPKGFLRHGETGKVRIPVTVTDAMLIPQKATFEIMDKRYVYVFGEDDTLHSREIEVSHELPHLFVVSKGLKKDDVFLVEGLRKVRDGQRVEPNEKEPAELVDELAVPAE